MTRRISLIVDDSPIEMDYFVEGFVDHTVYGMVSSLEGIKDISEIRLEIDNKDVDLAVNNETINLNDFVTNILGNTAKGMVSSLKGVNRAKKILITIRR